MNNEEVVSILKKGGIAVIPNDTIYGIICDALNEKTIKKIYELKNRDYSRPMLILVSDINMLKKCCKSINQLEERLINEYLPGELTIILNKSSYIPSIVSNKDTVGIRIPNDENLIKIISGLGNPIVSTSANISNKESITDISMLEDEIRDNVDFIYDGGTINKKPSTIIKVENNKIVILREGNLSSDIRKKFKENIDIYS